MKRVTTLIIFVILCILIDALWLLQNPLSTTNNLNSVKFISTMDGCAVGKNGTIIDLDFGTEPYLSRSSLVHLSLKNLVIL